MSTYLVCRVGRKAGTRVPLETATFVIGRDATCDLRAKSAQVAARHCAIVRSNGFVVVKDLSSQTGTYVNGRRVQGQCRINSGDKLRVGPLEFVLFMETAAVQPIDTQSPALVRVQAHDDTGPELLRLSPPQDADVALADVPGWPMAATVPQLLNAADRSADETGVPGGDSVFTSATVVYVSPRPLGDPQSQKDSA